MLYHGFDVDVIGKSDSVEAERDQGACRQAFQ